MSDPVARPAGDVSDVVALLGEPARGGERPATRLADQVEGLVPRQLRVPDRHCGQRHERGTRDVPGVVLVGFANVDDGGAIVVNDERIQASAGDEIEALAKQVEAAQADVEAANATIKQSEAAIKGFAGRVVETKKEYDRQRTLDKQGATSKRAVETARANWVAAVNQKANAEAQLLQMQASLSEAKANLAKAQADLGAPGEQNAQVRLAKAEVQSAELNLEFTQQKAPVDGYVTNLNLRLGSQAVANQPIMALVDVNSYWITGFFRENYIEDIRQGDRAIVTLMSYPDKPLEGRVDSLGWGIAQEDGSTSFDLLPNISPTFEWIRLAQRVPVRVHLDRVPEEVKLRVGTTASVLVMTGTESAKGEKRAVALPKALQ